MTDQAVIHDARRRRFRRRLRRNTGLTVITDGSARPVAPTRRNFFATLDKPMLAIVILLLIIGSMMVYSSTFDWSNDTYGTSTGFFVEEHLRNVVLSSLALLFFAAMDYRFWKRFAIWLLLFTIGALIAVLLVGDDKFGARAIAGGRTISTR